jgi:Protein of unknown function (DUF1203)
MEDDMRYVALPTDMTRHYQTGGLDANGQLPEHVVLGEESGPCRHCLKMIPKGAGMLILAHRPFPAPQPYAEIGPIFLCADRCERAVEGDARPEALASPDYIVRGYGPDDRIVYETGGVIATEAIPARAEVLFGDPGVAYIHVRSARNNCYQVRIDRG